MTTVKLTRLEAIRKIRERITRIDQMPDQRIVQILEACVQKLYKPVDGDYTDCSDPYYWCNFVIEK